MKKPGKMFVCGLGLLLALSGCASKPAGSTFLTEPTAPALLQPAQSGFQVTFSNLADPETRQLAEQLLSDAGISEARRSQFFAHVDQFNTVAAGDLTDGFEQADPAQPGYDPYELQDRWMAAYPDFNGYNCRITAFSLFGDFVTVSEGARVRDRDLMFDLLSLEEDPSAFPGQKDAFAALYSSVPTGTGTNIQNHLSVLRQDWQERGIAFRDVPEVRLISVVFHSMIDEESSLFIGHTGLLLPVSENEYYFLEKLAFQEPYQLVKLTGRAQLNEYLMRKYDTDVDQPMAAPFILENDRLMQGYQRLR